MRRKTMHGRMAGCDRAPAFSEPWEELRAAIVRKAADAGAKFVVCFFGMTLRTGNREYYFAALEKEFPGIREKYLRTFGNVYVCQSPNTRRLAERFHAECDRLGLMWRFSDINQATMARQPVQTSLFD